ncbi:HDOD domain-containing protein [Pseudohaliea sp.]|uniref:HDOD domain-containing protein n=1 Tax=Pseudohaliea sp. TaxID=2740289 RepID=UPI0032EAE8B3
MKKTGRNSGEGAKDSPAAALPTLPAVISLLSSLRPGESNSFDRILELARCEPCFAVDVLMIAGQLPSIEAGHLESLESALGRIGISGAKTLVEGATSTVFTPVTDPQRLLWLHSLQVANASELLAVKIPEAGIRPAEARLAGLLHDLGRFADYLTDPTAPDRADAIGYQTPEALRYAERTVSGHDHVTSGTALARALGLPRQLCQVISAHHGGLPEPPGATSRTKALIDLIAATDTLSVSLLSANRPSPEQLVAMVRRVTPGDLLKRYPAVAEQLPSIADRTVDLAFADYGRLGLGRTRVHEAYGT